MAILERENLRNSIITMVSGVLFSVAWWILIDVASCYPDIMSKNKMFFLPGVCGTIAMIIVLLTPYRTHDESYMYSGKCSPFSTVLILFFALVFSFGAIIWATYFWIGNFLLKENMPVWPGLGIWLQNVCILIANLQMKFGRIREEYY